MDIEKYDKEIKALTDGEKKWLAGQIFTPKGPIKTIKELLDEIPKKYKYQCWLNGKRYSFTNELTMNLFLYIDSKEGKNTIIETLNKCNKEAKEKGMY